QIVVSANQVARNHFSKLLQVAIASQNRFRLVHHSRSATRISRAATLNLNRSARLTAFASRPLLRGSSTQVFFIIIILLKMSFPRLFMLEFIVVKVVKELFEM
ncbi:hypothetical protein RYX36_007142, partial [Vicia faba]